MSEYLENQGDYIKEVNFGARAIAGVGASTAAFIDMFVSDCGHGVKDLSNWDDRRHINARKGSICYGFSSEVFSLVKLKEYSLLRVINLLSNENTAIRQASTKNLGDMKDEKGIDPLIRALSDENKDVREGAKRGIKMIGGPVVESLLRAFFDSDK